MSSLCRQPGEPFGLVIVEALLCGTPVVARNALGGGPRYILDDGQTGMIVEGNNPATMASALEQVIASPDLQNTLRENGRRRAEAFTPRSVAHAWIEFIEKLD